jgi:hypothetical protein
LNASTLSQRPAHSRFYCDERVRQHINRQPAAGVEWCDDRARIKLRDAIGEEQVLPKGLSLIEDPIA